MNETLESVSCSNNLVSVRTREGDRSRLVRVRGDGAGPDSLEFWRTAAVSGAVVPAVNRGAYEYDLPGTAVSALDISDPSPVRSAVGQICDALTAVHGLAVGTSVLGAMPGPRWIRRLGNRIAHIRNHPGDLGAAVRREIPDDYGRDPRAWYPVGHRSGLLHGAPSLADVYIASDGVTVLLGEDGAAGLPEMDWGYLRGEIQEIAQLDSFPIASRCAEALEIISRHTSRLDGRLIDVFAEHRRVLHALDYIDSFVENVEDLPGSIITLLGGVKWTLLIN
ncbi:hypothetical protein [Nocardia sp. NPDC003963]